MTIDDSRADFGGASLPPADDIAAQLQRLPGRTWVNLLRDDQSRRWRSGRRLPVEEYFQRLPDLLTNRETALVLICGEIRLREELGDEPLLPEYQRRFPEFAWDLALQFEINRALDDGQGADEPGTDPLMAAVELRGYEILEEIGRGAFSIVYCARQLLPDRLVAIKSVAVNCFDARQRARQFREAELLATLQHPNVIRIHEAFESTGQLHLVMEYVDGPTLAQHCGGRALPPRDSATLLLSLAEAVDIVHKTGVLHRDLKPTNVLLKHDGTPMISDFGLARWINSDSGATTESTLLGTPNYMAPEQALGSTDAAAPTADVYSLGAILYELLTGRPPFFGPSLLETLTAIREREPTRPSQLVPHVPRDLETIVLTATARNPANRYLTAGAFADDLRRFLTDRPIAARRASRLEASWRWCRRNRGLAALYVALLVALLGGVAGITRQWRIAVGARREAEQQTAEAKAARSTAQAALGDAERARQSEQRARMDAAARALELQTETDRLEQASRLVERARNLRELRRWDDAVTAYSAAIDLRPDRADIFQERGRLYLGLHLVQPAAEDIEHAFSLTRLSSAEQWRQHALLRLHVGDHSGYEQACLLMHQSLADGGNPPAIFEFVRVCSTAPRSGVDPQIAATLAESVIDFFRNPHSLYALGLALYRAGQWERAEAACLESAAGGGEWVALNEPILAMAQSRLGRESDARQSLRRATRAQESWMSRLFETTDDFWTSHKGAMMDWPIDPLDWLEFQLTLREAHQELDESQSDDPRMSVLRARAYAGLSRPTEAIAEYDQALALLPDDPRIRLEAYRIRGYDNVHNQRFQAAAAEYAHATELAPEDGDLWRYMAIAQLCAGEIESYKATCRECVRRFATTDSPNAAVAVVEICVCHADALEDWNTLLPLASKAAGHLPDSIRFLAAAQYRAGEYPEAVETFARLESYCRLRAVDLFILAMAEYRLTRTAEAQRSFDEALAWISEADAATEPATGACWGAWTERPEVLSLQQEAAALLAR